MRAAARVPHPADPCDRPAYRHFSVAGVGGPNRAKRCRIALLGRFGPSARG